MAGFGEDVLPYLETIIRTSPDAGLRYSAVETISLMNGGKVDELLALAMEDPAEHIRALAGKEVAKRGNIEALTSKATDKDM